MIDPHRNHAVAGVDDRSTGRIHLPPGRAERGSDATARTTARAGHHCDALLIFGHTVTLRDDCCQWHQINITAAMITTGAELLTTADDLGTR
jgi:hypothetical protein